MKGVLITGGLGKIGFNLVEKLLETDANITVLDLESRDSVKRSLKFKDKIKMVFGDVEDANLVRDLVKRNDIVINYAGIMPPLANLNDSIADATNFKGTKNIVDAIQEVNPECILIQMSFISIYGTCDNEVRRISIDTESTHPDDYYSVSLIRSEDYVRSNLTKYAIFRMPIVLTRKNYFIKHMKLSRKIDFITPNDLNEMVVQVMKSTEIYGKVYNVSGIKEKASIIVDMLYKTTGRISIMGRNLYYGEYEDAKEIEDLVDIKYTSLDSYFSSLEKETPKVRKTLRKIINFPKYLIFKRITKR